MIEKDEPDKIIFSLSCLVHFDSKKINFCPV
jgi:hypothetical protein